MLIVSEAISPGWRAKRWCLGRGWRNRKISIPPDPAGGKGDTRTTTSDSQPLSPASSDPIGPAMILSHAPTVSDLIKEKPTAVAATRIIASSSEKRREEASRIVGVILFSRQRE